MPISNINIVSNIYIRKPESVQGNRDDFNKDPNFVAQVSGTDALLVMQSRTRGIMSRVKLSSIQKEELAQSSPCSYALPGEIPFGKVLKNGKIEYECRCESKNCSLFKRCNPKPIHREDVIPIDEFIHADSTDILTPIDIFKDSKTEIKERKNINEVPLDEAINITEITKDISEFQKIDASEAVTKIIESGLESHILVNAGPGTGKTYTAIQRLLYILNKIDPEDCDRILVLCYTKAAVAEIKNRIEHGIDNKTLPYEALNISICTLDSFATSYLLTFDEVSEHLTEFDYNQRIQLFNQKIEAEDFDDFKYCIIDELQDLVNDRAIMTLQILRSLKCGYLLLGDKCQAIYDYDCKSNNSINSTQFYENLKQLLPHDTLKYEITGNKRQTEKLNKQSEVLRNELLNYNSDTLRQKFIDSLLSMPKSMFYAETFNDKNISQTTAILCRNNGEAEYMSWILHKNHINHNLIRTNYQKVSLHRCIADALWDFANNTISDKIFHKRIVVRSGMSDTKAKEIYSALSELLYDEHRDYLECDLLAKKICKSMEAPNCLLNANNSMLTVSTIHKAKGREFDKVYLLGYNYEPHSEENYLNTEEERILYVAETRPKKEIKILQKKNPFKWYFRKNQNNRWIRTEQIPYRQYDHCVGFATGNEDDIDYSSFAEGDLNEAVKRQEYISTNIREGDSIYLRLNNGQYDIIHKDTTIGRMSISYNNELQSKFRYKNGKRQYVSQLPYTITNLYVKNIFTYVSYKEFDNIPHQFRKNRFWLAVEITGFGRTIWQENS